MELPHLDTEDKTDLVDLLTVYLEGCDPSDLDDIAANVKVKLALAAAGEGVISQGEVICSSRP